MADPDIILVHLYSNFFILITVGISLFIVSEYAPHDPPGFFSYISIPLYPHQDDPFGLLYTGKPIKISDSYYIDTSSTSYSFQLFRYQFFKPPKKAKLHIYHNLKNLTIRCTIQLTEELTKKLGKKYPKIDMENHLLDSGIQKFNNSYKKLTFRDKIFDFSNEISKLMISCTDITPFTHFYEADEGCKNPSGYPILSPETMYKDLLFPKVPYSKLMPFVNITIETLEAIPLNYQDPPFLLLHSSDSFETKTIFIISGSVITFISVLFLLAALIISL